MSTKIQLPTFNGVPIITYGLIGLTTLVFAYIAFQDNIDEEGEDNKEEQRREEEEQRREEEEQRQEQRQEEQRQEQQRRDEEEQTTKWHIATVFTKQACRPAV